jgi:hypothetical protein
MHNGIDENSPLETRVTPWKLLWWEDPTYSHVRIWAKNTQFGVFQRHEWKYYDGTTFMEQWIPSIKAWPVGAKKVENDE